MNITEDKLKAAIQIALGTLGLYTQETETLLTHHIKALTIPVVVGQSEQLLVFADFKDQWEHDNNNMDNNTIIVAEFVKNK